MKTWLLICSLTLPLLAGSLAEAGEPTFNPYCKVPKWLDITRCKDCPCPDDYNKKCLPAAPCPDRCKNCDDYCPKCLPAAPCPAPCACCDDYLRKCGPIKLSPCLPPWFTCGPQTCSPKICSPKTISSGAPTK